MQGGPVPLSKVSKPVLFTLIFAIGMIIYLYGFSGKKTLPTPLPKPQAPQNVPAQQQGILQNVPGTLQALTGAGNEPTKNQARVYSQMKDISWGRNPFAFPGNIEETLNEQQTKGSTKLVAIINGRKEKVVIINNQIVGKGDMVGKEKVYDIGDDTVILIHDGIKRIVTINKLSTADVEIKVKKR